MQPGTSFTENFLLASLQTSYIVGCYENVRSRTASDEKDSGKSSSRQKGEVLGEKDPERS
jgi:hypothetical protein